MSPPPSKPRIVVGAAVSHASKSEKLLGLLILLIALVLAVFFSHRWNMTSNANDAARSALVLDERDALQQQLQQVRQQLAIAQRGDQVTGAANDQLRTEFVAVQEKLALLRADIEFYQRLLGAAGAGSGLAVHGLQLERTAAESVYRFDLTLSQNLKKAQVVAGTVSLFIDGVQGGRAQTLDGTAIEWVNAKPGFEFKYFQLLRGSFTLPQGFIAERVRVSLVARSGPGKKPLWRDFTWAELFEPVSRETKNNRVQ